MRRIVDLAELGRLWASGEDPFPDEDDDEDYGPIPCDRSVCCPCGSCDALGPRGADTPSRRGEQHRRPSARVSAETVGPGR
ncbi:hypothetical protein Acsp07_30010 [Actinomycetospora sp. NBRC 106378]|nr:hypothetical protein Acsp07_30010 [Actinomycetospora sp. NBRC 106378]